RRPPGAPPAPPGSPPSRCRRRSRAPTAASGGASGRGRTARRARGTRGWDTRSRSTRRSRGGVSCGGYHAREDVMNKRTIHHAALLTLGLLLGALPGVAQDVEKTDLFVGGQGGYAVYRIPGIIALG